METNNFKKAFFEDLKTLQHKSIPTLSAKELYGTLFKYLGLFFVFMIGITMLGDVMLMKIGFKHIAKDSDDVMAIGIMVGGGFALFLCLAITGFLQKLIVFKKAVKPLMKTGDDVYKKIQFICRVYSGIYLLVLTVFSFFIGTFGFGHFPAIIGTLFIGNAFLQGEITRLGIPELPKIIEQISEGKPVSIT